MSTVVCSLCTSEIDINTVSTTRYPGCGHVIHLQCFVDDPDHMFFVTDCKSCLLVSFLKNNDALKLPKVFPPTSFAVAKGKHGTGVVDSGDSFRRQAVTLGLVNNGLQQRYSGMVTGFRHDRESERKLRQGKAFVNFIDTINSTFGATTLALAQSQKNVVNEIPIDPITKQLGKSDKTTPSGPTKTYALPYEIGGTQTWLATRSEKHHAVSADLRNGIYVDLAVLSKNGFDVTNIIETGLSLHTLLSINNYTLQELVGYGFTWAGLIALGLTMEYFKMPGVFVDINVLLQYFPGLSIYHLLCLPPNNIHPFARLEALTALGFSTKTLIAMRFDIPTHADLLTAQAFINLSKSVTMEEMTQSLSLNGKILKNKDLLNKGFFHAMEWNCSLRMISMALGVKETSIDEYGVVNDDAQRQENPNNFFYAGPDYASVVPQPMVPTHIDSGRTPTTFPPHVPIVSPSPQMMIPHPEISGLLSSNAPTRKLGKPQQDFLDDYQNSGAACVVGRNTFHKRSGDMGGSGAQYASGTFTKMGGEM